MLTPDERAALIVYCHDHTVAVCPRCSEALTAADIGTDALLDRRDFCPRCRAGITWVLRKHLTECTWMRVQAREAGERAREVWPQARETAKESRQLRDRADVLGREAEAAQQRSRGAMGGRPLRKIVRLSRDEIDTILHFARSSASLMLPELRVSIVAALERTRAAEPDAPAYRLPLALDETHALSQWCRAAAPSVGGTSTDALVAAVTRIDATR
jgi:hypothetical protein